MGREIKMGREEIFVLNNVFVILRLSARMPTLGFCIFKFKKKKNC